MRGSTHTHMFIWTKEHPDLETESGDHLFAPAFIDKYVSTTLPDVSDTELKYLVDKLQTHHHTNSCQKRNKLCRFDFPKPESEKTRIMTNTGQGNTSRFYVTRRQKTDSTIQSTVLKAWRANMDIQLVRNDYGVAMYICTYICKSEPDGLKSAIRKVFEQLSDDCSQRKRIHAIGSTVLFHRQISAQEVAFRMTNFQ